MDAAAVRHGSERPEARFGFMVLCEYGTGRGEKKGSRGGGRGGREWREDSRV